MGLYLENLVSDPKHKKIKILIIKKLTNKKNKGDKKHKDIVIKIIIKL